MSNSLAPFVPTQNDIVKKMLELVQVNSDDVLFDLGCGDGRILFAAVKDFGAKKAIGYEIRKDLYDGVLQEIKKQNLEHRIVVFNDNLLNAKLTEATVITLYLTNSGNNELRQKLIEEAKPGTRIVSNSFDFTGWSYYKKEEIDWHTLYLYTIPEAFIKRKR